jgi:hypothetical protein
MRTEQTGMQSLLAQKKPIMQMEFFPSFATTTLGIWLSKI